jgi:hypothetical protein
VRLRRAGQPEASELAVTGLFVFIGAKPGTGWLAGQLAEDRHGFVMTGSDIQATRLENENLTPSFLETSRPGIFAIGNVRSLITDEILEWLPICSLLRTSCWSELRHFASRSLEWASGSRLESPTGPGRLKRRAASGASGLRIPVLPRLSATRLSQRRFWRGRVPEIAIGEVTLRPTPDLLQSR